MGKSLGIASFVILMLSLPIPVVGNYLSLLAVLILCGAAWAGEKTWVVVVDLVAWVKMFLLSPSWHILMFSSSYLNGMARATRDVGSASNLATYGARSQAGGNMAVLLFTVLILAAPIAILAYRSRSVQTPSKGMRS